MCSPSKKLGIFTLTILALLAHNSASAAIRTIEATAAEGNAALNFSERANYWNSIQSPNNLSPLTKGFSEPELAAILESPLLSNPGYEETHRKLQLLMEGPRVTPLHNDFHSNISPERVAVLKHTLAQIPLGTLDAARGTYQFERTGIILRTFFNGGDSGQAMGYTAVLPTQLSGWETFFMMNTDGFHPELCRDGSILFNSWKLTDAKKVLNRVFPQYPQPEYSQDRKFDLVRLPPADIFRAETEARSGFKLRFAEDANGSHNAGAMGYLSDLAKRTHPMLDSHDLEAHWPALIKANSIPVAAIAAVAEQWSQDPLVQAKKDKSAIKFIQGIVAESLHDTLFIDAPIDAAAAVEKYILAYTHQLGEAPWSNPIIRNWILQEIAQFNYKLLLKPYPATKPVS